MSAWALPVAVTAAGSTYRIRSDYRAVIDALAALGDAALEPPERVAAFLQIMTPDWTLIRDAEAVYKAIMLWINLGAEPSEADRRQPSIIDWQRDEHLIAPAISKVLGQSVRSLPYLHWYDFIGAYNCIDTEGAFATVIGIRSKRAKGKPLDKWEKDYLAEHPDVIGPVTQLNDEEKAFFASLGLEG